MTVGGAAILRAHVGHDEPVGRQFACARTGCGQLFTASGTPGTPHSPARLAKCVH